MLYAKPFLHHPTHGRGGRGEAHRGGWVEQRGMYVAGLACVPCAQMRGVPHRGVCRPGGGDVGRRAPPGSCAHPASPPPPPATAVKTPVWGEVCNVMGGGWGGGAPPAAAADAWGRPCHPRCGCASATLPAVCGRGRGRVCPRLLWRGRLCPRLLWRGRLGGATPCVRQPAAGGGVREGVGSHPRGGATRVLTTRPT